MLFYLAGNGTEKKPKDDLFQKASYGAMNGNMPASPLDISQYNREVESINRLLLSVKKK